MTGRAEKEEEEEKDEEEEGEGAGKIRRCIGSRMALYCYSTAVKNAKMPVMKFEVRAL